jgi:integrase
MNNRLKFNKSTIAALPLPPKGQRSTYYDTKIPKLAIRITASGSRTFYVIKRAGASIAWLKLGSFPDMTVEIAQNEAEKVLGQFAKGENPAQVKRDDKAAMTLGQAFERYLKQYAQPRGIKRTDEMRALWERCIGELPDLPAKKHGRKRTKHAGGVNWQNKKLEDIETAKIRALHSSIGATHSTMANRVIELISTIYNRAIEWGYKGENPTKGVRAFSETKRDRFMQPEEFPKFLSALAEDTSESFKDFVMIALLTGARRENVLGMRWEQISFEREVWRIPEIVSKSGETMVVPLSKEAIAILESRKKEAEGSSFVFPAISKTGYMSAPKRRWAMLLERAELQDLTLHDLRRTMGSWQAITGASLVIIGKSLGHKSHDATAIYARLNVDPVRISMQKATSAMLNAGRIKQDVEVTE